MHISQPVTWTVRMIGCPYYSPYYSKPVDGRVLTEAIGAAYS
jgi:hypothetical protein